VIPPAELGELEAFRSMLSGEEQAEIGGALCELPGWLEALTSGTRA
jgi:hypothetical protein